MHESRPTTSMSLLLRAQAGDDEAWAQIVRLYGPLVFKQCLRRRLNRDDARDVTQNVFIAIDKGLSRFRREEAGQSFLHWLRKIASNQISDFCRRQAKQPQAHGGTTAHVKFEQLADEFEAEWSPTELKRDAQRRALELLKTDFQESSWRAFWMCVVEGQKTKDVAEVLAMKESAVRMARSRVLRRLKDELGDLLD